MTELPEKPKERHRAQVRWTEREGHVDLEGAGGIALGMVFVLAFVGLAAYTGIPLFPMLNTPQALRVEVTSTALGRGASEPPQPS